VEPREEMVAVESQRGGCEGAEVNDEGGWE
jgi:hypothetical protein